MQKGLSLVKAVPRPSQIDMDMTKEIARLDFYFGCIENPFPPQTALSDEYIRVCNLLIKGLTV